MWPHEDWRRNSLLHKPLPSCLARSHLAVSLVRKLWRKQQCPSSGYAADCRGLGRSVPALGDLTASIPPRDAKGHPCTPTPTITSCSSSDWSAHQPRWPKTVLFNLGFLGFTRPWKSKAYLKHHFYWRRFFLGGGRCDVLSRVWLFATPWTVTHQPPLSTNFSRQEYQSRLPFPTPGDLPNPGITLIPPESPALAGGFFSTVPPEKAFFFFLMGG